MKNQILWSVVTLLLSTNAMTAFATSFTSTEPCKWVVTVSIAGINEEVGRVRSVSEPRCETLSELVPSQRRLALYKYFGWAQYSHWAPYKDWVPHDVWPYAVCSGQPDPDMWLVDPELWPAMMLDEPLHVVTLSCSWVRDTTVSLSRSEFHGGGYYSLDSLTSNNPRCSAVVAGVEVKDGVELKLGALD